MVQSSNLRGYTAGAVDVILKMHVARATFRSLAGDTFYLNAAKVIKSE